MHIGFIYQENPLQPLRGTGFYLRDLVRGLLDLGHEVTCIQPWNGPVSDIPANVLQDQDNSAFARLRLVTFPMVPPQWMRWRPGQLWHRWKLRQFIRQLHREASFDVLETMDGYGWFPFGGINEVPLVVRLHGADFFFHHEENRVEDTFAYWLEKQTIRKANAFVGVSHHVVRATLGLCGRQNQAADATVIYNAVDTEHFAPGDPALVEPHRIFFVNTIEHRKGVDSLIEAFPAVLEEFPDARLILAGGLTGQGAQEDLQGFLAKLPPHVRERVEVKGRISAAEKLKELHSAGVCCYPSRSEAFGISPVEAMSAGKPVIYSQYGPGPEVIVDGESGLLCDPAHPETITSQILKVLRNPQLSEKLGNAARCRTLQLFDHRNWSHCNQEFFESQCSAK